jgi:hypothetical protein
VEQDKEEDGFAHQVGEIGPSEGVIQLKATVDERQAGL